MKTRTKTATSPSTDTSEQPIAVKPLPKPDENPRRAFILPDTLSKDATIISLPHSRTLRPTKYYYCKKTGYYEIKQFHSGPGSYRSLLLTPPNSKTEKDAREWSEGYVVKQATFFAVTPIDALFLMLPALSRVPKESKEYKSMFLSLDDHLESLGEGSKHLRHTCDDQNTLRMIEQRISHVCDKVKAGEESMYRLNHDKLLQFMIAKAETMVKAGLPPSMESHFVTKPLQIPMARLLQQEESTHSISQATDNQADSQGTPGTSTPSTTNESSSSSSSTDSQTTTLTTPSPQAPLSPTEPSQQSYTATPSLTHSLRLRTALIFLFSSYIPAHLVRILENLLTQSPTTSSSSSTTTTTTTKYPDFNPLTLHLTHLTRLKSDMAARARELMTSSNPRKRGLEDEDDEAGHEKKKRRLKEEENLRRKKGMGESRGVRDLKKVDTAGMRKMSSFFGKKV